MSNVTEITCHVLIIVIVPLGRSKARHPLLVENHIYELSQILNQIMDVLNEVLSPFHNIRRLRF